MDLFEALQQAIRQEKERRKQRRAILVPIDLQPYMTAEETEKIDRIIDEMYARRAAALKLRTQG
jgi:hypothetical protein